MMNIAELLVASLENAGVITAYGVPGEENTHFMQALEASSIEVVLTRHEQAAAFMASVHAKITGQPALCFATLGPGATNLVTGVADAQLDHAPMIVVTGQGARQRLGKRNSHQLIDLEALFEPVTKFSRTMMHEDSVAGLVAEAVRIANEPETGPVHLSLPEDLAAIETEDLPVSGSKPIPPVPAAPKSISDALEVLKDAEHPLIVAGHGVIRAGAASEVRRFVEHTNIPLATTFMAKGLLPADHSLHLHCIGQPFDDHIDSLIASRDLIVAVGYDPVELPPSAITGDGTVPVLHVGTQRATLEHDWSIACDVPGDIGTTLRGITAALNGSIWPEEAQVREIRERVSAQRARVHGVSENKFHPADVLRIVESKLTRDTLVLSGVGTHKMEIARYLAATQPNQILIPNGLAGMGLALPGAIAAARLRRHNHVLAICGDGDFMMNVQDMETANRLGVSLTVLLWEDNEYGLIKAKQEADTGEHTALSFGNPDWADLAKSFGWQHTRASQLNELDATLDDHRNGLLLVTLSIDYSDSMEKNEPSSTFSLEGI